MGFGSRSGYGPEPRTSGISTKLTVPAPNKSVVAGVAKSQVLANPTPTLVVT